MIIKTVEKILLVMIIGMMIISVLDKKSIHEMTDAQNDVLLFSCDWTMGKKKKKIVN